MADGNFLIPFGNLQTFLISKTQVNNLNIIYIIHADFDTFSSFKSHLKN